MKLYFLHTTKLKAKASLQVDTWLYNEIMVLKKKFEVIQKELDHECAMRAHLERQIGNIHEKIKEYELELSQLIRIVGKEWSNLPLSCMLQ